MSNIEYCNEIIETFNLPSPPKKPRNAYIYFYVDEYNLKKNNKQKINRCDLAIECGEKWNNMNVYEKNIYINMQWQDRLRYINECN